MALAHTSQPMSHTDIRHRHTVRDNRDSQSVDTYTADSIARQVLPLVNVKFCSSERTGLSYSSTHTFVPLN